MRRAFVLIAAILAACGGGPGAVPIGAPSTPAVWPLRGTPAPKGAQWRNSVGTQTVTSTNDRVAAPQGRYSDCIEIRTTDNNGQSMYWTFAPGVGFVRFGRGRDAYLLSSFTTGAFRSAVRLELSTGVARHSRARRGL